MKRLFYIEKEKFLCEMLESVLSENDVDCYSLNAKKPEEVLENLFLIKDMNPDTIFFDLKSVGPTLAALINSRNELDTQIPLVATGSIEEYKALPKSQLDSISSFIKKPLSPFQIYSQIF